MTFYTVSSGATSSGIILRKGDFLYVSSGGTAEDITVSSGGTEFVFSGGTSSDTVVHAGGAEFVYSTGSALDATLSTGGYLIVLSGGEQSGTVRSGGSVVSTGVALVTPASGTTVYSGAASGVVLGSGAIEFVLSDGVTSNTTVDSGGYEAVGFGGSAVGTVVSDGGYEAVSGGASSDGTVHSGGFLAVSAGGVTVSTVVDSGGTEHVYGGASSDTVLSSGGIEYVFPAGSTVSTAVDRGGTEVVYGGGTSISSTVSSGGTEIVYPGGNNSGTTVSSGGNLVEPSRAGSGGLVIDVDYDASVASAPAGFETTVNAAVAYLESQFSTPITITIDVGYGEVDGTKLTHSDLGESADEGIHVSYSDLRSALLSRTATSDEIAAAAGLPATDPAGSTAEYFLSYAEAEALGLSSGPGAGMAVGDIGLSSTSPFTYGTTNGAGANTFDAFGIVEHEITEVMGRADDLGDNGAGIYTPLDLFRYDFPGVRELAPNLAGYFSIDGNHLLYQFNDPSNGGDAGDWSSKVADDSFDAFASEGVANPVSPTDLRVMDVIGYTPASAGSTIVAWSNPVSADFSTALDWSGGVVPNSTTLEVLLAQLGSYTVSVGAGESFAAGAVTVSGSGGTLLVNGTITMTGTSLPDGNLVVGKNQGDDATLVIGITGMVIGAGTTALEIGSGLDANGTVMVNGGTLGGIGGGIDVGGVGLGQLLLDGGLVNAGTGDIEIGTQSGDFGLLAVNGGGAVAGGTLAVGGAASSGFVEIGFTGAGTVMAAAVTVGAEGLITLGDAAALLSTSGALTIGGQGTGATLTDAGTVQVAGSISIGVGATAASTGDLGIGSGALSYAGGLVVGGGASGSSGTLGVFVSTLSGTGTGSSVLGQNAGSDGVVGIGGGTWNANGPLVVGASGSGLLTITEGTPPGFFGSIPGLVNAGTNAITIGAQSGGTGTVDVEMGTLEGGDLLIGSGGSGTLDVSLDGRVELAATSNVNLGAAPGSSGTLTIDSGGLFDADGYFAIGAANASGTLLVESVGTLTTGGASAFGDIDASGSGTAAATVNGSWIVDGPIFVGNTGAGTLVVQGGGLVDAAGLYGGVQSTGDGDIVVTGTASALTLTGQLVVGDASSAELSILSGATVIAANGFLGSGAGGAGVVGLAGSGSALEISNGLSIGGTGTGTLTMGANTTLAIAGQLSIGSRGVLQQSGGVLDAANLTNAGSVTGGASAVVNVGAMLLNDGIWAARLGDDTLDVGTPGGGGGLAGGAIGGTGSLVIGDGGDLIVSAGTVFASQSVAFSNSGTTGVLTIGTLAGFAAVIDSFNTQAEILVAGTSIVGDAFVANTLTLFGGGGVELGTLAFGADAVSGGYLTTSDGGIVEVQCFAAGTRIRTDRGEVAVEAIGVGDKVCVLLGDGPAGDGVAPVIWVGRREVDCTRHPAPGRVWPVRVAAGAFGPGQPHSALFLSPDHAVYVGDVLIPVRYLVNGSTIVQVPRQRVVYHHLELAEHDVLLAQGLPTESFLDMRDGSKYPDRPGPVRLYPDASARMWEAFGCARLVVSGPELAAARALVNGIARAVGRASATDELAAG